MTKLKSCCAVMMASGIIVSSASADSMGLLIPAYSYPTTAEGTSFWGKMTAAASSGVPVIAIMNPANGPGSASDQNYRNAISTFSTAGGKILGYVHTRESPSSLTLRNIADVKDDIDKYLTFYVASGLAGIFVDEMRSDADSDAGSAYSGKTVREYYQAIYSHVVTGHPSYKVVGNPGTSGGEIEKYIQSPRSADTLITFENLSGYENSTPPSWTANYDASNFAHIPYNLPETSMEYCVRLARARNVGYFYATDDYFTGSFVNPWDQIANYFEKEVQIINKINTSTLPLNVSLRRDSSQAVSILVSGSFQTYRVEISSDLINWNQAYSINPASGAFSWNDPSNNSARKFYRVIATFSGLPENPDS